MFLALYDYLFLSCHMTPFLDHLTPILGTNVLVLLLFSFFDLP